MIKQRKDPGTCRNKKEKATQEEKNNTTRRKTQKVLVKEGRLMTKQEIPKQQKKILSTTERRWLENIPTTGYKRNQTILD